ncbi:unnamed protein product [Arabidopsis halleri]
MDYPQGINKVSTSVTDNDNKLKKHNLEAEKRLKKVEQDYLHISQKYTETRSQWLSLYDERRRAVNSCSSAGDFIDRCNKLVEQLQNALDNLPITETAEETVDHSLMFNSSKSLAIENMMILQHKVQCQELDREAIRDFKQFSTELYYIQRKMPRSDSRKAVNDLLKEVKEKNKSRDKALSNCTLVCNPTSYDNLRKYVELEIKVLKKLIRELQKDWEEKLHIKQYARNIYTDFKQKVKHLEKKKDHLAGQWDDERKLMRKLIR